MSEAARRPPRMTVEEFVRWGEAQPGRHELRDGEVVTMQSERVAHVLVKTGVFLALREALRSAASSCRAFGDGVTIKIDANTAFEPACTVHRGPVELDSLTVPNPVVVVEALSPASQASDFAKKLPGYFAVPSVEHGLIVDPEKRMVIHHSRAGEVITTRFLHVGTDGGAQLTLDPPGIFFEIADFFAELDAA